MLAEASSRAIREIGEFHESRGIAGYRQAGAISMATCTAQVGRWRETLDALARAGRAEMAVELTGDEIRLRTGCPLALAGLLYPDGATVQPAFYARGLRAAALEAGVRIYEHTPMLALRRDRPALVETPAARSRPTRSCSRRTRGSRGCAICGARSCPSRATSC